MYPITSHTINEDVDIKEIAFAMILEKIKAGVHYFHISQSFENYYYMLKEALEYYKSIEDFESCGVFENNLKQYIDGIPKDIEAAIKYMVESVVHRDLGNFLDIDTYTLAINMHQKTGFAIMDMWLLRHPISPLTQYCTKKFNTENPDEIVNKILTKYIDALKATLQERDS